MGKRNRKQKPTTTKSSAESSAASSEEHAEQVVVEEYDDTTLNETEPSQPPNKKNEPKIIQLLFSKSFLSIEQACETIQTIIDEESDKDLQDSIKMLKNHNAIQRLIELLTIEKHNPIILESAKALTNLHLVDDSIFNTCQQTLISQLFKSIITLHSNNDNSLHPTLIYDHKDKSSIENIICALLDLLIQIVLQFSEEILKEIQQFVEVFKNLMKNLEFKERILHLIYLISGKQEILGNLNDLLMVSSEDSDESSSMSNAYLFGISFNLKNYENFEKFLKNFEKFSENLQNSNENYLNLEILIHSLNGIESPTTTIKESSPLIVKILINLLQNSNSEKSNSILEILNEISKEFSFKEISPLKIEFILHHFKLNDYPQLLIQCSQINEHFRLKCLELFIKILEESAESQQSAEVVMQLLNGMFDVYADEKGIESELKKLVPIFEKIVKSDLLLKGIEGGGEENEEENEEMMECVEETMENLMNYIDYIKKTCY